MQDHFVLISRHGIKWIITDNQNIAIQNVLSAVSPT